MRLLLNVWITSRKCHKMMNIWIVHCKKSWRSSSTPASGDAGPIHTGVEKSFRHPWRKFYYKYLTFPTFFTSVKLVRQSRKVSKAACGARTYALPICHSTTAPHFLVNPCTITLGVAHTYKKMPASCASSVEMLSFYTFISAFFIMYFIQIGTNEWTRV